MSSSIAWEITLYNQKRCRTILTHILPGSGELEELAQKAVKGCKVVNVKCLRNGPEIGIRRTIKKAQNGRNINQKSSLSRLEISFRWEHNGSRKATSIEIKMG